jgi:hypothetical protein
MEILYENKKNIKIVRLVFFILITIATSALCFKLQLYISHVELFFLGIATLLLWLVNYLTKNIISSITFDIEENYIKIKKHPLLAAEKIDIIKIGDFNFKKLERPFTRGVSDVFYFYSNKRLIGELPITRTEKSKRMVSKLYEDLVNLNRIK